MSELAGMAERSPPMRLSRLGLAGILPFAFAFVLWFALRPYGGIGGDARIYIGGALADLDPQGLGRDFMFALDGQSQFSVFPLMLRHLVNLLGADDAAILLASLALVLWFAAITGFASRFVMGRGLNLALVFVAAMPRHYGPFDLLYFAEPLATPRPFAEALVIGGLASLIAGRPWLTAAMLATAAAFHPIMALGGIGIAYIVLCLQDRRWLIAGAAGVAALLLAALLGLPLAGRLFTLVDPEWKAILESRNTYLFPLAWPPGVLTGMAVQSVTILIAARRLTGRARLVMHASVAVAVAGTILSAIFGDRIPLLLVLQAQPWRMGWLIAALSPVALAVLILKSWQEAPPARTIAAFLVLAWAPTLCGAVDAEPLSLVMCAAAAGASLLAARGRFTFSPRGERLILAVTIAMLVVFEFRAILDTRQFVASVPPDISWFRSYWFEAGIHAVPVMALATAWALGLLPRTPAAAGLAGVAALVIITFATWDTRDPVKRGLDAQIRPDAFAKAIAEHPGEVLWLEGDVEPWLRLGRASWASQLQGASLVFSREQAMLWKSRIDRLIAAGLGEGNLLAPYRQGPGLRFPALTPESRQAFCAAMDAPAFIIVPLEKPGPVPGLEDAVYWQPESPRGRPGLDGSWTIARAYALVPCAAP